MYCVRCGVVAGFVTVLYVVVGVLVSGAIFPSLSANTTGISRMFVNSEPLQSALKVVEEESDVAEVLAVFCFIMVNFVGLKFDCKALPSADRKCCVPDFKV